MKLTTTLAGLALLLLGCQVPLLTPQSALVTRPGMASLTVNIQQTGFGFVPVGTQKIGGRFVIEPSSQAGVANLTLHDPNNVLSDLTGTTVSGVSNIPPGVWDLTVELRNVSNTAIIGTETVTGISLVAGGNTQNVTVHATQGNGTGSILVSYQWPGVQAVTSGSFLLYGLASGQAGVSKTVNAPKSRVRLTASQGSPPSNWTVVSNPTPMLSNVDAMSRSAVYRIDNLPSGSYKLVLQLYSGASAHPPVSATVEVYDGLISDNNTQSVMLDSQLSGPPDVVGTVALSNSAGYPWITWNTFPSTATGVHILRNGVSIADPSFDSGQFSDATYLTGGAANVYEVQPFNDFGSAPPTPAPGTFVSVSSLDLTVNTPMVPLNGYVLSGTYSAAVTPVGATIPGYDWRVSDPGLVSLGSNGSIHGLGYGKFDLVAASHEASGPITTSPMRVDSWVETFVGSTGTSGSNNGTGSGAQFDQPTAAALGPDGMLYLTDMTRTLRVSTPLGVVSDFSPSTVFPYDATALTFDNSGNIYALCGTAVYKASGGVVTLLAGDPNVSTATTFGGGTSTRFLAPGGIAWVDGYLYVPDYRSIVRIDAITGSSDEYSGTGAAGNTDNGLAGSTYDNPKGIVYDGIEYLYVANTSQHRIRRIHMPSGTVATIAGTGMIGGDDGLGSVATFANPTSLAIMGGALYVVDNGTVIRRIDLRNPFHPDFTVSTVAGQGGVPGGMNGPGSGSTLGLMTGLSIAAGPGGLVYAPDTTAHVFRRIQTSVFDSIGPYDAQFDDTMIMQYNYGNSIPAMTNLDGKIRVGTILLAQDGSLRSKIMITSINADTYGSGIWRITFDWTTWDSGSVINQGANRLYDAADISAGYFHAFDGSTNQGEGSDGLLIGGGDGNRILHVGPSTTVGIYQ